MRINQIWPVILAVTCLILITVSVGADERKIEVDKVPKAVLDAVKAKFPKAKLTTASQETESGKTIYEVAFVYREHKFEVECTADGNFVAIDRQLKLEELPKVVAKTLTEKFPRGKYEVIEEVTKKNKIECYEVEMTTSEGKKVEVQIDPSGKVIKEETKQVIKEETKHKQK